MKRAELFNEIRNMAGLPKETDKRKIIRFTHREMLQILNYLQIQPDAEYRTCFKNIPGYLFQGKGSWDANTHKDNLETIYNLMKEVKPPEPSTPSSDPNTPTRERVKLSVVTDILEGITENVLDDFKEIELKVFNRKPDESSFHINLWV